MYEVPSKSIELETRLETSEREMANKLLNKIKASLVKTAGSDTESFEEEKHHETQVTDILLVIRREKQIRINKKAL